MGVPNPCHVHDHVTKPASAFARHVAFFGARVAFYVASAARPELSRPELSAARPEVAAARPDGSAARPDGSAARPDGAAARDGSAAPAPDGYRVSDCAEAATKDHLCEQEGDEEGDQVEEGDQRSHCS